MAGFLRSVLGKQDPAPEATAADEMAVMEKVEPLHVTDETFQAEVLNADTPVLVDFWAPWCGPCKMIAPLVDELATEYAGRVVIAKLDTDRNGQVPAEYGIMGIPTLLLFKGGKEVDRIVGLTRKQVLQAKLEALLAS
jgi:thioredoxin 1